MEGSAIPEGDTPMIVPAEFRSTGRGVPSAQVTGRLDALFRAGPATQPWPLTTPHRKICGKRQTAWHEHPQTHWSHSQSFSPKS